MKYIVIDIIISILAFESVFAETCPEGFSNKFIQQLEVKDNPVIVYVFGAYTSMEVAVIKDVDDFKIFSNLGVNINETVRIIKESAILEWAFTDMPTEFRNIEYTYIEDLPYNSHLEYSKMWIHKPTTQQDIVIPLNINIEDNNEATVEFLQKFDELKKVLLESWRNTFYKNLNNHNRQNSSDEGIKCL